MLKLTSGVLLDLEDITLTEDEIAYLHKNCPYFPEDYINYLKTFRFKPEEQIKLEFIPITSSGEDDNAEVSPGLCLEMAVINFNDRAIYL